jgi:hypothetical protein
MPMEKDTCFYAALNVYLGRKKPYALYHKEFISKQMQIPKSNDHRIFYVRMNVLFL